MTTFLRVLLLGPLVLLGVVAAGIASLFVAFYDAVLHGFQVTWRRFR